MEIMIHYDQLLGAVKVDKRCQYNTRCDDQGSHSADHKETSLAP